MKSSENEGDFEGFALIKRHCLNKNGVLLMDILYIFIGITVNIFSLEFSHRRFQLIWAKIIQKCQYQISFKKFRQEIKFISTVKYCELFTCSGKQGLKFILNWELSYTPVQYLLLVDRCIYSCIKI